MNKELTLEFKVENKAVPAMGMRLTNNRYPFGQMKVGQSFFIPGQFEGISSVRSAALSYGKRHDMKFAIVRDGDGYRCGRIG